MPIALPEELTDLRRQILAMAAEVEHRVTLALTALRDRDRDIAKVVRRGDDVIDQMEIEIEQECLRVLALSQPVAGDLRFVLSVMRINSELERIADLARSVAKRTISLTKMAPMDLPAPILMMADKTRSMLAGALEALSSEEVAIARRIRRADDQVDELMKEIFVWVKEEIPLHVEATAAALDVLSIARKLERIGDLSTNIAEEVIFIVEGTLVRHARA